MSVHYDEISIQTDGEVDIIDITNDIQKIILNGNVGLTILKNIKKRE